MSMSNCNCHYVQATTQSDAQKDIVKMATYLMKADIIMKQERPRGLSFEDSMTKGGLKISNGEILKYINKTEIDEESEAREPTESGPTDDNTRP